MSTTENTYKKPKKEIKKNYFDLSFLNNKKLQVSIGFCFLLSSIFLFISFISYIFSGQVDQSVVESYLDVHIKQSGAEVKNIFGFLGAHLSYYFIFKYFGLGAFFIPPLLFIISYRLLFQDSLFPIYSSIKIVVFYTIWVSLLMGYFLILMNHTGYISFITGGVGYELALLLKSLTGKATVLIIFFFLIIFNILFFNLTSFSTSKITDLFKHAINWLNDIKILVFSFGKKANNEDLFVENEEEKDEPVDDEVSMIIDKVKKEMEDEDEYETNTWIVKKVTTKNKTSDVEDDLELIVEKPEENDDQISSDDANSHHSQAEVKEDSQPEFSVTQKEDQQIEEDNNEEENTHYDPTLDLPNYQFPSPALLTAYPKKNVQVTQDELEQNKDKIVETLINFKISISSIKATIGPTVTLYEIIPQAGVKISKIKNLEDDIALSLAALGIRIIAPIPGKGTIGIEVPNKNREMVDMRSLIITKKFVESKMELPVVLGKTISNEVYVTDLTKMPHLLMAGATGQGKSVGLNIMLTSLLYKKHPSQLKFILVDPKKVELSLFNKIENHFLAKLPNGDESIITDTSKVVNTLNSLCIEMDERYELLKMAGCRNLKEYNNKFIERKLNPNKGHRYLPYIVLVIDELADLMITAGKEIEMPIARLAQLARAIGIHLIVATQRPSVNVITGVIKANFPARLSFRVTSKIDSRTILDTGGADQLVGMGDMLLSTGSEIIRLQCAFVDTLEVDRLCKFVETQQGYSSAYLLPEYEGEDDNGIGDVDLSERDSLFEDAAKLIVMHQQGSTSLIQRKMKLGYNRAGRLIDQLETAGIVGSFEGSKAREVLVADEYELEKILSEINIKYKK